jgi:hypothetical protein
MHIYRDVFCHYLFHEGNELLRDPPQDDARIGPGVDPGKRQDEIGGRRDAAPHRETKKLLFRVDMSQNGSRGDPQLRRDVGERGGLEPLYREHPPGGFKKLIAGDAGRPSH